MSPMLDVQRRHATTWRLRAGERGPKGEPRRLTDQLRITSMSQEIVTAFSRRYGGQRRPWEGQWEVHIPVTELAVVLLPGQSLTQWWECWDSGGCLRRCDGLVDVANDADCSCPTDVDERMAAADACRPTTRLSVVCPEVDVMGAGMLVSHGLIAASTLPQAVAVASAALSAGATVPATLRIVTVRGRRTYIVPQLELVGVSLAELAGRRAGIAPAATPAIAAGTDDSAGCGVSEDEIATVREMIGWLSGARQETLRDDWRAERIPSLGMAGYDAAAHLRAVDLVRAAVEASQDAADRTSGQTADQAPIVRTDA